MPVSGPAAGPAGGPGAPWSGALCSTITSSTTGTCRTPSHRLHGFSHPWRALENAERDFPLGPIERDTIVRHMFPLTLAPPKYREGALICAADKLCALCETVSALGLLAG